MPLIRYSLPTFLAEVLIDIASDPESGSVRANEPIISPVENFGRYLCFCSSVPDITIVCDPMPILVPAIDLNAGEALPNSNVNLTSCSIDRFDPPYFVGIEIPNRPIFFISSTISSGILLVSATSSSLGISLLSTNFFIVSKNIENELSSSDINFSFS